MKARFLKIALLLAMTEGAGAADAKPPDGIVIYSAAAKSVQSTIVVMPADKKSYVASLEPDMDVYGNAIVLTLVLHLKGEEGDAYNLLDETGSPGAKSWSFAAPEFENGIKALPCGQHRRLYVRQLNSFVYVDLIDAEFFKTDERRFKFLYMFKSLVLRVQSKASPGLRYSHLCAG